MFPLKKTISVRPLIRWLGLGLFLLMCIVNAGLLTLIIKSKQLAIENSYFTPLTPTLSSNATSSAPISFPIGVDPAQKLITENPFVDSFISEHIASNYRKAPRHQGWLSHIITALYELPWYQNLASPTARVLVIRSGERAEEVVASFGGILKWTPEERVVFKNLITEQLPVLADGKFYPGFYHVSKDADPLLVADLVIERFNTEIQSRYTPEIESLVPLAEALVIASLLEREAYDFNDMRYISGIIWNRLFIDMRLQLDASLQYAKGSRPTGPWWPRVIPQDKFIDSPFNTYKHAGLPPSPIANPSVDAVIAALNPRETDCLFYFHDARGGFHCTETYEEHVALLKKIYGQGK